MTNLTKENFKREVEDYSGLVVIDIWATWCGPCMMLAPVIDELERDYPEVKFCKINVDEEPELASKFGVMSIPTLVVMENGKISSQAIGARPKNAILAML